MVCNIYEYPVGYISENAVGNDRIIVCWCIILSVWICNTGGNTYIKASGVELHINVPLKVFLTFYNIKFKF